VEYGAVYTDQDHVAMQSLSVSQNSFLYVIKARFRQKASKSLFSDVHKSSPMRQKVA